MIPVRYCLPRGEGDLSMVVKTWADNFKRADAAGILPSRGGPAPAEYSYDNVMSRTLWMAFRRPGLTVWLAVLPDEEPPLDVAGFMVSEIGPNVGRRIGDRVVVHFAEKALVHYVYVKNDYRRHGIARGLFAAAGIDPTRPFLYSCRTSMVAKLAGLGHLRHAEWNPAPIRHAKDPVAFNRWLSEREKEE